MLAEADLLDIIKKAKVVIVSYIDEKGYPISKAMLEPRKQKGLQTFWFSTNTSSNKVMCWKENPHASIYFINQNNFKAISLVGTVEVLENEQDKKELWCEGDELYYPKGIYDPDYCVLKFTTIKGRFYENFISQDFEL